jgi:hypothetical protein
MAVVNRGDVCRVRHLARERRRRARRLHRSAPGGACCERSLVEWAAARIEALLGDDAREVGLLVARDVLQLQVHGRTCQRREAHVKLDGHALAAGCIDKEPFRERRRQIIGELEEGEDEDQAGAEE